MAVISFKEVPMDIGMKWKQWPIAVDNFNIAIL